MLNACNHCANCLEPALSEAVVHVMRLQIGRIEEVSSPLAQEKKVGCFKKRYHYWNHAKLSMDFFLPSGLTFWVKEKVESSICQECFEWRVGGLESINKVWDSYYVLESQRTGPTSGEQGLCFPPYPQHLVHSFHVVSRFSANVCQISQV